MAPDFLLSKLFSLMGLFAFIQTLLPPPLRSSLARSLDEFWTWLFNSAHHSCFFEVPEHIPGGHDCSPNVFYRQVGVYLGSLDAVLQSQRVNVSRVDEVSSLLYSVPLNESLEDSFRGAKLSWTHNCTQDERRNERRSFSLTMPKSDRSRLLDDYFQHILNCAGEIERRNTKRFLYTNDFIQWQAVSFNHPSTFDTLALEADLTDQIKADLQAFSQGEDYYHRIGRAWKRGYLLYGPPGTGKSSMIAAIANFLHYNIYDVELTKVTDNSMLKTLLMQTTRKSVIVIEDIDCSAEFSDRSQAGAVSSKGRDTELTLSGLLNFTDGLWSCCGEERIFIFTTNHKERLDGALLRAGRMDLHILLSYMKFEAFRKLAQNYLGIEDHELYGEVRAAMDGGGQVTPAAAAEVMMSSQGDADAALRRVLAMLDSQ